MAEHHEVIIIGAGYGGLAAAKTYLAVKPSVDLLLIDRDTGIGGVWSKSRIYEGLRYEWPTPGANFSDFDMRKELGMGTWENISATRMNDYLVRYAERFDIIGRCRFNVNVLNIERGSMQWKVIVQSTSPPSQKALLCDKLIVATGMNSIPRIPELDLSKFDGFSFHSIDIASQHEKMIASQVDHVTIVGGHKTALETVGLAARAGKRVEWLIREQGGGTPWMMQARNPDGSSALKPVMIRCFSKLGTSVYKSDKWLDRFFHSGQWALGTWFVTWFWKMGTDRVLGDRFKSENGAKLKPKSPSSFWLNPGGTILQEQDQEVLRMIDQSTLINVNIAHITLAHGKGVSLNTGERVETDGIVFCTGWDLSAPPLFSDKLTNDLGLPTPPQSIPAEERTYWNNLDQPAENRLVKLYPCLERPPSTIFVPVETLSPFRLYRQMVPPKLAACNDNSLIFLTNYSTGQVPRTSEIYALWAVAYLENLLPTDTKTVLLDKHQMDCDIALNEAYRKKRFLNAHPVRLSVAETSEHDENILSDLGLRNDRKRMRIPNGWKGWFGMKAWWAEWFEPYFPEEYAGIIEEFLEQVALRDDQAGVQGN